MVLKLSTLKQVSTREAEKILAENGFTLLRKNGDHKIYARGPERCTINQGLNKMVWRRLVKTHHLKVNYMHKIKMDT